MVESSDRALHIVELVVDEAMKEQENAQGIVTLAEDDRIVGS